MVGIDPMAVISQFHAMLTRSMVRRANGTVHLRTCRNANVNAQWYACQDACTEAQELLRRWKPRTGQRQAAVRRVRS